MMEPSVRKSRVFEKRGGRFEFLGSRGDGAMSLSSDSTAESRGGSGSGSSSSETARCSSSSSSPTALGWPIRKATECSKPGLKGDRHEKSQSGDSNSKTKNSKFSEMEMMKERFSKLLLGEDMSGSGKGVCSALAISNAITNLSATVFGQLWRLEPLPSEKVSMWLREMEWLLCTTDHIVELIPSLQTYPNGNKFEVMTCRPRTDLVINIPALRKLDNILIEILDSFSDADFWYVDQGIIAADVDGSAPLCKPIQRQEEKWWLPVPRVPAGGLRENSKKQLHHKRECANQILKAAMAINSTALADMEVPQSYLETLPKNGRACLGDVIYRYITSDHFSSECLLDCLDISSEHVALEIANRLEASIHVWHRRTYSKPINNTNRSTAKSSWEMVKELMVDGDKREVLAERAEGLLCCLKQRFPGLTQTTLDATKIQFNKDVGKSILESYSRVLESLAFNIVARIDDLLYVDDLTKCSEKLSSVPISINVAAGHKKGAVPYSVPVSGTPYNTNVITPSRALAPTVSPAQGERTPFLSSHKPHCRGFGVRRVLTNYLGGETRSKNSGNEAEGAVDPVTNGTAKAGPKDQPSSDCEKSSKDSSSACKRGNGKYCKNARIQ